MLFPAWDTDLWAKRELLRVFVDAHPFLSAILFLVIQTAQVVVAPIPGEATGFLAGFLFGVWKGAFLSLTGTVIGSLIAFKTGRLFFRKLKQKLTSREAYKKVEKLFIKYGKPGLFFVYLFPGFPKDLANYFAAFMPISLKDFLIISTLGRFPGIFTLALQGSAVYSGNIKKILLIYTLSLIGFLFFLYFKKSIERKI